MAVLLLLPALSTNCNLKIAWNIQNSFRLYRINVQSQVNVAVIMNEELEINENGLYVWFGAERYEAFGIFIVLIKQNCVYCVRFCCCFVRCCLIVRLKENIPGTKGNGSRCIWCPGVFRRFPFHCKTTTTTKKYVNALKTISMPNKKAFWTATHLLLYASNYLCVGWAERLRHLFFFLNYKELWQFFRFGY